MPVSNLIASSFLLPKSVRIALCSLLMSFLSDAEHILMNGLVIDDGGKHWISRRGPMRKKINETRLFGVISLGPARLFYFQSKARLRSFRKRQFSLTRYADWKAWLP